ncbi:MAG: glutamine amidotransferase, partial [Gammaproteobacteria bacterium]|nr:glutamine amidotransferase [Gammaproteobacteria bacterium]
NQAFRIGSNILALQFHPEVASDSLEKWLIGHSCELSQANIDIPALRAANIQFAPVLETTSQTVLEQYLTQLNIVS